MNQTIQFDPFAMANATFGECKLTEEFLSAEVRPAVESALGDHRSDAEATWLGLLLRDVGCLRSLGKLNHPGDYQAVSVAARTLFEIAVDVVIMHFDVGNPPAKLRAWEDSAKLKTAEKIKRFYEEENRVVPPEYVPLLDYIDREGPRVRQLRTHFWNGKHPSNRWTGRDLHSDAKAASEHARKGQFLEFYVTTYPTLCWNTHGSGLAGVRFLSENIFPAVSGAALGQCADLSMIVAEVVLVHLGRWDLEWAKRFELHNANRIQVKEHVYEAAKRRAEPTSQGG
jgi:hypothetical protein